MLKRRRTFQAQEVGELDFSEELLELGLLIGSYRTARGIKQEDMAKLLGMSRITLSRIENSWLPLTMENFLRWLLFLRCDRSICCRSWRG